ncbi:unnamed protein product [Parajaminaea phylloscopi]
MATTSPPLASPPVNDLDELLSKLSVEQKIAHGAEHLLQLFDREPNQNGQEALRKQVEGELLAASDSIRDLNAAIAGIRLSQPSPHDDASSPGASESVNLERTPFGSSYSALGLEVEAFSRSLDADRGQSGHLFSGPSTLQQGEYTSSSTGPTADSGALANQNSHLSPTESMSSLRSLSNFTESYEQRLDGERTDDQAYKRQALAILDLLQSFKNAHVSSTDGSLETTLPANEPATPSLPTRPMGPPLTPSNKRAAQKARMAYRTPTAGLPQERSVMYAEEAEQTVDLLNRLTEIMRRSIRARYELGIDRLVAAAVPHLAEGNHTETKAAAYCLIRHSLVRSDPTVTAAWTSYGLEMYILRSFLRDRSCLPEREQSLKLVRAILELSFLDAASPLDAQGKHSIGDGVIRAIIAGAESIEDPIRQVFLETLVELAIFDLPLLLRTNGLGTVLRSLTDGAQEIAPEIMKALLFLTDLPSTRSYFHPNIDLEYALSGYTDLPSRSQSSDIGVLRTSANIVGIMLRSWTGLFYLCMNRRRAIVSLITAMKVSPHEVQESIIQMLVDVFDVSLGIERTKQRARAKARSDLPELETADRRGPSSRTARQMSHEQRERNRNRITLIDQYLSILLIVFIDSGLVDALVHILQTPSRASRSATLLMGTILQMGNRVLPQNYNVSINQLSDLFASASQFNNPTQRNKAVTALSAVSQASASLHRQSQLQDTERFIGRVRSKSLGDDPSRRPQRQPEPGKIFQAINIDDATFRNQLFETQVLNTRDATKWNTDILMSLLQGPLLNPRRLDEAMRGTKLLRRLLAFFHPFALRFSDLPATPPNRVYIRLGCTLLVTLMSTPDGVKFIAEDGLLREIQEAFQQIDPGAPESGSAPKDPIFAKSRVTSTLSQGYFEMIGTLSASVEGVALLARFNIWSAMYRLCQSRSRDDIVRVMIEKLDFTFEGHPRVLLGWILCSGSRPLRTFATEFLIKMIRKSPSPGEWMISLLLIQLCDAAASVRDIAVAVVQDICQYPQTLEMVVALRPTLDHLGEVGHELLLRFLSTPDGVRYLLEGDYIDREMDEWFNERGHRYSVQMEVSLARAMSIYRNELDSSLEEEFSGVPPLHFYGELVKTAEGCEVLNEKGHFLEFAHFIRQHGMEDSDGEVMNKLKSILWTVGSIGATAGGFPFLEADGTLANIVDIAEHSPVLTIRGTCFYVIGMISATRQGAELLYDYGWQSLCTTFGLPIGICVPIDLDSFLHIDDWTPVEVTSNGDFLAMRPPSSSLHRSILASISNLANSILASKAAKTLSRLKQRHRSAFSDVRLFTRVLEMLNSVKYRQGLRKFVWDLFEVELNDHNVQRISAIRQELYKPPELLPGSKADALSPQASASRLDLASRPRRSSHATASSAQAGQYPSAKTSAHGRPTGVTLDTDPLEDPAYADGLDVYDETEFDDYEEHSTFGEDDDDEEGDGDDGFREEIMITIEDEEQGGDFTRPEIIHGPLASTIQHSRGQGLGLSLHAGLQSSGKLSTTQSMTPSQHGPLAAVGDSVVVDGFGEQKSPAMLDLPRYAPPPGVRVIGGFGPIESSPY